MKKYLVLDNGTVFEGKAFGDAGESMGELVFSTGMSGYIETLTDPSYYGQIVMQTFPQIGNYGMIEDDFEGKCALSGYVVREWCDEPSNFRSCGTVDEYLKKWKIPGICDVDTREITKILREKGTTNAVIKNEIPSDIASLKNYRIVNALAAVSAEKIVVFPAIGNKKFKVVLVDCGEKRNIARELCKRGCEVISVPYNTSSSEILSYNPDGIMLSNGPGNPSDNTELIKTVGELIGKKPMFGICLGHQIMALSLGGRTEKMKYGHRGANHPVRDLLGTRTYITSQNHGYAVIADSVPGGKQSFINANDGSCEGMDYSALKAFSVQFHPEACSGPLDTSFLFDRFCDNMKEGL